MLPSYNLLWKRDELNIFLLILLDLLATFDTTIHGILLCLVSKDGDWGPIFCRFHSYLADQC